MKQLLETFDSEAFLSKFHHVYLNSFYCNSFWWHLKVSISSAVLKVFSLTREVTRLHLKFNRAVNSTDASRGQGEYTAAVLLDLLPTFPSFLSRLSPTRAFVHIGGCAGNSTFKLSCERAGKRAAGQNERAERSETAAPGTSRKGLFTK